MAFLGIALDPTFNLGNAATISIAGSPVTVMVIETDEEQVIADEAVSILENGVAGE